MFLNVTFLTRLAGRYGRNHSDLIFKFTDIATKCAVLHAENLGGLVDDRHAIRTNLLRVANFRFRHRLVKSLLAYDLREQLVYLWNVRIVAIKKDP